MANPLLGRECRIRKNGVRIGNARNVTLTINGAVIDITSLGDTWAHNLTGASSYTIGFEYMYTKNNTEQDAIESAAYNRTTLNDIEIELDSTTYITCDIVADPTACMNVSSWGITFDNANVVSVPVTLTGSGPIAKFTS